MAVKMLEVPVHKARILLCNSRADARKVVGTHLYKDPQEAMDSLSMMKRACAASFESDGKVGWQFLYARRKPNDIAHEAVHIGMMVLEDLGVTISQENDEVLAYLVDHIVEAMWDKKGWVSLEEFLESEKPKKKAKSV